MPSRGKKEDLVHDDEIDLRELVEVLIRRRYLIATVFAAAVLIAAGVSLMLPRQYRASTSLMIVPSRVSRPLLTEDEAAAGKRAHSSAISVSTHKEILLSNDLLRKVIDEHSLTDRSGSPLSVYGLRERLDIERARDTNVLRLSAYSSDPAKARDIVNTWAEEFVRYIRREFVFGEAESEGDIIDTQFNVAKEKLIAQENKVKDFKDEHDLYLMRAEQTLKSDKLDNYLKELLGLGSRIYTLERTLANVKDELSRQDEFIVLSKAIADEALWQKSNREIAALETVKLRSESVNPLYRDLQKRRVDVEIDLEIARSRREYLKGAVERITEEINGLRRHINEKELELTWLERDAQRSRRAYEHISGSIEDVRMIRSAQLGEARVISTAMDPKRPFAPRRRRIVALASSFGLLFGVFLAFFTEFMDTKSKT